MDIPHIELLVARTVRSRGLAAIVVACPLVWALASVAEARPKSPPRAHHVAVSVAARQGDHAFVAASVPREPRGAEAAAEEALQNRLVLASNEAVTRSALVRPTGDGPSAAMEVALPLPGDAVTLTFVDPAGGHARVLPIEAANPYRVRN
jgi:hypothetical protein